MNTMKKIRLTLAVVAVGLQVSTLFADEAAKSTTAVVDKSGTSQPKAGGAEGKEYKPLAEARAKIGDIIADASKMSEVMKELSPEDQKTFLADVNAAIAKLPGSTEDKTAKYLNINREALKGAEEGNMVNVLAVTFATVPPESLVVLSERYATDLFNRDASPTQKFTDAAFEKTAMEVVGKVEQATTGSDDAGVRNTLAILMFVRASNNSIEGLSDRLVETMPDATSREMATKEWIPAAMAEGEQKSYESMLAYADAGRAPNLDIVLSLAGPQILDAMLVDITAGMNDSKGVQTTPVLDQAFGGFDDPTAGMRTDSASATATVNGGGEVPRTPVPIAPWNPEYSRSSIDTTKEVIGEVIEKVIEELEPKPYPYSAM